MPRLMFPSCRQNFRFSGCVCVLLALTVSIATGDNPVGQIQSNAIRTGKSPVAHWGPDPQEYISWSTHSNRLIPVYTFGTRGVAKGVDLESYFGAKSAYRDEQKLKEIYGFLPENTVSPDATAMDQTDVFRLQQAAIETGRKHVILIVFDGMDWETTRAAAIAASGKVYETGRGSGLHFLDYQAGGSTQYGWMVTSPHNEGTNIDVNRQTVANPGGKVRGGYDLIRGGATPWAQTEDRGYLIGKADASGKRHAYTDSSSSATSMTAGIKTYNNSVNVDATGNRVQTIAHIAQDRGMSVGAVTSVPISHATPASAYAHNVHRNDYQDLTRDLLGRPSISHPEQPLSGLDVLIGGGAGVNRSSDGAQGKNFAPGNRYLAPNDLKAIDVDNGGRYEVVVREAGTDGSQALAAAAETAAREGHRLFGLFGVGNGHLPYAGAGGDYQPSPGKKGVTEKYGEADITENATLPEMTSAALTVLSKNPRGFWLMVESGDVDWANHANNLDASVGAVQSGDAAFRVVTDWVEKHSNWNETVVILTADHGHYLVLDQPSALAGNAAAGNNAAGESE